MKYRGIVITTLGNLLYGILVGAVLAQPDAHLYQTIPFLENLLWVMFCLLLINFGLLVLCGIAGAFEWGA